MRKIMLILLLIIFVGSCESETIRIGKPKEKSEPPVRKTNITLPEGVRGMAMNEYVMRVEKELIELNYRLDSIEYYVLNNR